MIHSSGTKMTALFSEGDTVLAYHGPMIYESKVLKFQESSLGAGRFQYYVHYLGWNKKWDEWVDDHRYVHCVPLVHSQLAPAFARSGLSQQICLDDATPPVLLLLLLQGHG